MSVRAITVSASLVLTVFGISACSSNLDQGQRTRLTSPADRYYAPSYPSRGAPAPGYAPSETAGYRAPPHPRGCAAEPVAPRPYPAYVTVARGENLCRIAKRYQTTVQAIVDTNRLPSPILSVGTRLRLPSNQYYSETPFGRLRRR